jgi:hypothetical protein
LQRCSLLPLLLLLLLLELLLLDLWQRLLLLLLLWLLLGCWLEVVQRLLYVHQVFHIFRSRQGLVQQDGCSLWQGPG